MKFKEGDKIIFCTPSRRNIYGTISRVCHEARVLWDYDVLEKDTGDLWNVFEYDITGMWDEYTFTAPHLRNSKSKYQVDTWVYFKGPNNQYYQGLIKEYDCKDCLYKIEYFDDNGFVKNAYTLEKEILDLKFKSGEEVQFRCFAAWKRGKICASYADRDGRIFYDINPWDEMIKAYDSLIGYKEIQEMDVRPYTIFTGKKSYEYFKNLPLDFKKNLVNDIFGFREFRDNAVIKVETDSIKTVLKEDNMNNRPRNHKFVRINRMERRIKEVMFNGPATIIKWEPTMDQWNRGQKGDKTVSVCGKSDIYDKEKGFLLAVIKEFVDNQSYDNILRMMDSFNDEERK